jgi:hypothetical protein
MEIHPQVLFGINDSVKKISLSDGNSIEFSKCFGIVRFTLPNDTFTLVGIDQLYGESVPGFKEIFRFSVGDLFEFHEIPAKNPDDQFSRLHIDKILITDSREHGDTLEYDLQVKHYDRCNPLPPYLWYTPGWASSSEYISTWRFINTPNHPANLYNNQLLKIFGPRKSMCFTSPYPLTKSYIYRDTDDIYVKVVGSYKNNDWFILKDSTNHLLEREQSDPFCDISAHSYKVGLGEIYFESDGFEYYVWRELIAFRKGNDTTGIFTPDEKMVVRIDESTEQKIRIFPNPANEYIKIELPGFNTPDEVTLLGMDGRSIIKNWNSDVLPLNNILKGIYILKVEYNNNVTFIKVLISPIQ